MRAVYIGHESLMFSDYIDLDTGRTLAAEPGGTYDVAPASGRVVPEFPEPWFARAPVAEAAPDLWSASAGDDPETVPATDDEPDDE